MRHGLLVTLILLIAVSCIDQKDYKLNSLDIHPSMAFPLAFGNLTIQDILKNKDSVYIKVYPDNLVYLDYSTELVSRDIRDLFNLPDKTINQSFSIPQGVIPPHAQNIHSDSLVEVVDLGLSPEKLTMIDFKSGTITYSASVLPPSSPLLYEVLLTSTNFVSKTTGQGLSLVANGTAGSIPLSDYKVNLTNNKFNLKMVLVLKQKATSTSVGPNTSVAVNFSMAGMDFNVILGYFGDQTVNPPSDTLTISAFGSSLQTANLSFAQPMVTLNVVNDYGVPCKVNFSTIEARKQGSSLPLQLNPASPVTVAMPATLGSSATTPVAVTNAKAALDFGPTEIFYQMSARINQGVPSGNNFMADSSKLRVRLDVEIPLFGHASGIVMRDTSDLDLGDITQSQVTNASLKVDVTNELPLDATIQLYLADDQYNIIDALLDSTQTMLIKGSSVTGAGELDAPGVLALNLQLDNDKLGKIFTAKNLIIVATLNTSLAEDLVDVKFKSTYTLKINVGLKADLNFNIKL